MKKLNLLKANEGYYTATETPEIVNITSAKFLSVPGHGSFVKPIYRQRIEALSLVANTIADQFNSTDKAFEVPVFECLYWMDEKLGYNKISDIFFHAPESELEYRLLVRLPEFITIEDVINAVKVITAQNKLAEEIKYFEITEGKCVQILHKGPFEYEEGSLIKMENYIEPINLVKAGHHHEIYLVDFTKEKNKNKYVTVLRDQVKDR